MSILVRCTCGASFEVEDDLAGGITNCRYCEKAVEVEGLRDPLWRVIQGGAIVFWALASIGATAVAGPWVGAATAIVLAGLLWAMSKAF